MSKNELSKNIESKKPVVAAVKEKFEKAQTVVLVDFRGLTVEEDTALRTEFRKAGVEYAVIKNTMIQRAADKEGIEGLNSILEGPTAVAFGGTSLKTTAPAAIFVLSPTVTGPSIFAPAPISTLLPIVGCRFPISLPVPPRVTP